MSLFRFVPLLLVVALAAAAPARAAADEPREQAAAHYRRGIDLVKQGNYEGALAAFNEAYAKSPHFAVLYNIGQTQIALSRPLAAIEALSTYLREGADKVPLSRREQVQAQIALLEAALAELTIVTDRPGVAIRVDERDVGRTPLFQPIRLPAGTHTITATAPDGAQLTQVVTLTESERQRLALAFPDATPATPPAVTTTPAMPPAAPPPSALAPLPPPEVTRASLDASASQGRPLRRAAYVSAGLGVAAAGAALGLYLWNRGRYEDWQEADATVGDLKFGSAAYRKRVTENNDLASSLISANRAIVGLSIAGGVLVATGVTLWLVERRQARATGELAFSWTGSSAQLGWSSRW